METDAIWWTPEKIRSVMVAHPIRARKTLTMRRKFVIFSAWSIPGRTDERVQNARKPKDGQPQHCHLKKPVHPRLNGRSGVSSFWPRAGLAFCFLCRRPIVGIYEPVGSVIRELSCHAVAPNKQVCGLASENPKALRLTYATRLYLNWIGSFFFGDGEGTCGWLT